MLTLSACTTNPYTGESQVGKSGYGAGIAVGKAQNRRVEITLSPL